jgi:hypothetical protein
VKVNISNQLFQINILLENDELITVLKPVIEIHPYPALEGGLCGE